MCSVIIEAVFVHIMHEPCVVRLKEGVREKSHPLKKNKKIEEKEIEKIPNDFS